MADDSPDASPAWITEVCARDEPQNGNEEFSEDNVLQKKTLMPPKMSFILTGFQIVFKV